MSLADKLSKKLEGGKFRLLNEKMYKNKELTCSESIKYHEYYANQIKKWPADPTKLVMQKINDAGQKDMEIADLGCGNAEVSRHFKRVRSFDKYPVTDGVIKCELSEIPAQDGEFDVAICCLSLMMTYVTKVLKETNRILKVGGTFYFVDVTSRIRNMRRFINDIEKFGFKLKEVDTKNTHFCMLIFGKVGNIERTSRIPTVSLNPWVYKKR